MPWKDKLAGVTDGVPDRNSYINANLPYSINIPILEADDYFQDKKEVTYSTAHSSGGCNKLSSSDEDKHTATVGVTCGFPDMNSCIDANLPYSVNQRIMFNTGAPWRIVGIILCHRQINITQFFLHS